MRTTRPSKPCIRSASAALAPAMPPPTMTWVLGSGMAVSCQCEELLARAGVVADAPQQRRGDGARARLLDAAQGHAQVLGLEDDADALAAQLVVEPVRDLGGQALLHLQGAGEVLDDAGELGQPDDPLTGQVADVGDAHERQQVVL